MKVKINVKRPLIAIAILLALSGIGTTIAYHTANGTFTNLFRTIFDQWTVTEEFVSPDNWQQCQIVPKKITTTNTGNAAIGVRAKYEEYWKLANNNSDSHESDLPLQYGGQNVALVNLNTSHDWEYRDDGYYYYTRPLEPGQTTSSVIDYVEYNCDLNVVEENNDCTTVNGSTTCTRRDEFSYDNAKYHLFATVEITDQPETYNISKPNKATITTGTYINIYMKRIANSDSSLNWTSDPDTKIRAIKMADALPDDFVPTWQNSFNYYSDEPEIRGWFDNTTGTFYFHTDADYIETPEDMRWAFQDLRALEDISGLAEWRTHNTTSMQTIFDDTYALNDLNPLAKWETSKNTSLAWAFYADTENGTSSLTNVNALANWNTDNVTAMNSLFNGATNLTDISALSGWNTQKVTTMGYLLWGTALTNVDALSDWKTGNVQYLDNAFSQMPNLKNVSGLRNWDTHSAINFNSIFFADGNLTDISGLKNWNTGNVVEFHRFMSETGITNVDALRSWNVSSATSLDRAFGKATKLKNVDGLIDWNIGNVTNLYSTFTETNSLENINGLARWDTKNVTNMGWLFGNSQSQITSLSPLRNWDVRKVTSAYCAFYAMGGHISSLDGLQNWQTDSLENAGWMFANNGSAFTDISQIAGWNLSHITNISRIFSGDSNVNGSSLNGWAVPSGADTSYAFTGNDKPSWYQE